jgi:pilus assembly protein CpaB
MKRVQLIAVAIALVAAGLAFVVGKNVFVKPPPAPVTVEKKVDSTEVLVAGTDISVGQVVTDGNFRWVAWPSEAAGRAYITKQNGGESIKRELGGSIARFALLAGEPITQQKLIKPGQGGVVAAILPQGMRAIATEIAPESAAGGLILPNDHVDVLFVRRIRTKSGQEQQVSDTLFRNVRVIAIGQQIETKEGKKSAENSKTATLELTPRQTEVLALANATQEGEIYLTLRSVADLNSDPSGGGLDLNKRNGSSVRVLRYGAKSRAYGVN